MSKKQNILVFIDWFTPAFKAGGPIKSVANIVESLHSNFNFYIITSYYDVDSTALDVHPNTWETRENCTVLYLDSKHQNREFVLQSIQNISFESIYFNSLFSKNFSIKPLSYLSSLNTKMVLAPRGMLGAGALKIKPIKKWSFLTYAKQTNRYKKLTWHASSIQEEKEIKRHFGENAKVDVALNLFEIKELKDYLITKNPKELNLFFFSRIAKKKNLHFALRCLKELDHLENIHFQIIGPIEELNYWESCKAYFMQFKNIKVSQYVIQSFSELNDVTRNAHFLFLPTLHENFGHVIAESLALAKPIIISDQTPWDNLEVNKVGFKLALSQKEEYVNTLLKCYEMDGIEYANMQENCIPYLTYFKNKYSSQEKYNSLFKN